MDYTLWQDTISQFVNSTFQSWLTLRLSNANITGAKYDILTKSSKKIWEQFLSQEE